MSNGALERNDFAGVIDQELEEIDLRRGTPPTAAMSSSTTPSTGASPAPTPDWKDRCHEKKLFGICISGGGIRSATFALGVLQGLTKKGLLQKADYLSTVSGGGYIGSWIQGILNRPADPADPYEPLTREVPQPAKTDPITFLRKYSNYLAPRHGLSIDTLLIPMIWTRNMMLNQTIIVCAFLAAFLLAFLPGFGFRLLVSQWCPAIYWLMLALAFLCGLIAVFFMAKNLREISRREFSESAEGATYRPGEGTGTVATRVVLPISLGVLSMMSAIFLKGAEVRVTQFLGLALLFTLFAALQWFGGFPECYDKRRNPPLSVGPTGPAATQATPAANDELKDRGWIIWHVLWMSIACSAFTLLLLYGIRRWAELWCPNTIESGYLMISFAPPLYILALMGGIVLQIGLMGQDFPDSSREWLARAGTLFWTATAVWAGFFALALFIPYGIASVVSDHGTAIASAVTAWLGSTAAAVLAGKSAKSGDAEPNQQKSSTTLDMVARYGPFVAILGFLVIVACAAQWLIHVDVRPLFHGGSAVWPGLGTLTGMAYWQVFDAQNCFWYWPLVLCLLATIIFTVLSWRVNINEFSMHHFYKNRLVRCYMGASASKQRKPDWFTGFDPRDDMPLWKLRGSVAGAHVPYPIVNATLNVSAGTDLATQERKGVSWIFTPWYSGFYPTRSNEDRKERGQEEEAPTYARSDRLSTGVALGTAMAISGAAANPNWGAHSSPQTAFLLTLFNVRLGWWMGNPSNGKTFTRSGPVIALWWLFRELFGFVDEGSKYLNLSDGGHFENLGMYELIRRRCRYVIAIDGEADPDYRFEGLGGAVRKCRADFGIDIVINPRPIQLKDGVNRAHCVVGRIHYPEGDGKHGWLLYIKSSVTGDEPADVEEYRREHPDFPQQSTIEQFFTESQFESYRMLGLHVVNTALDRYNPGLPVEESFARLAARWEMPPQAPEGVFTRHAEAYSNLMTRLADHPLMNLDAEVVEGFPPTPSREAVFFWLELIQLAENIFLDLNLADEQIWKHPVYAGWRRVFRYWASRPALQAVWGKRQSDGTRTGQADNYGKAFRDFFDDLIEENTP